MKRLLFILLIIFNITMLSSCNKSNKKPGYKPDYKPDDIEDEKIEITYPDNSIFASNRSINGCGTKEDPYTIEYAFANVNPGQSLYLLDGLYNVKSSLRLTKTGNLQNPIIIKGDYNANVVLDFGYHYGVTPRDENLSISNKASYCGIIVSGSYYDISSISVTGAGSTGIRIHGNYNKLTNCVIYENGNTGLNISATSKDRSLWPHDNIIKNCTSFGNFDWNRTDTENIGEDADGFGCKLTAGENNVFDGCISYNNSDDGWDLFTKQATGTIGAVTIKNSIAFSNGYGMNGEDLKNGNGFKLGGRAIEVSHYVENCIAFDNKANGFDDNSNPGEITLKNCTAYNNLKRNIQMGRFVDEINTYTATWYEDGVLYGPIENVPKSHNILEGCISYKTAVTDSYIGFATNCYFANTNFNFLTFKERSACNHTNIQRGTAINAKNPFVSTTSDYKNHLYDIHKIFRDENGDIKLGDFLKLKPEYQMGANLH